MPAPSSTNTDTSYPTSQYAISLVRLADDSSYTDSDDDTDGKDSDNENSSAYGETTSNYVALREVEYTNSLGYDLRVLEDPHPELECSTGETCYCNWYPDYQMSHHEEPLRRSHHTGQCGQDAIPHSVYRRRNEYLKMPLWTRLYSWVAFVDCTATSWDGRIFIPLSPTRPELRLETIDPSTYMCNLLLRLWSKDMRPRQTDGSTYLKLFGRCAREWGEHHSSGGLRRVGDRVAIPRGDELYEVFNRGKDYGFGITLHLVHDISSLDHLFYRRGA